MIWMRCSNLFARLKSKTYLKMMIWKAAFPGHVFLKELSGKKTSNVIFTSLHEGSYCLCKEEPKTKERRLVIPCHKQTCMESSLLTHKHWTFLHLPFKSFNYMTSDDPWWPLTARKTPAFLLIQKNSRSSDTCKFEVHATFDTENIGCLHSACW